jgi:hypothetical protein
VDLILLQVICLGGALRLEDVLLPYGGHVARVLVGIGAYAVLGVAGGPWLLRLRPGLEKPLSRR